MRILLTSPRAPVTLDLSRRLSAAGNVVFVCDSLHFAIGNLSRSISGSFAVPHPRSSPTDYVRALNRIVDLQEIDLLIPTCEECFYIAAMRDEIECNVLVDSIEKLNRIHNKWTFSQDCGNEFAIVPKTYQLKSKADLEATVGDSESLVYKPTYSRFASETLIGPSANQLSQIEISSKRHCCLLYTSPSPRDRQKSRMPSSA